MNPQYLETKYTYRQLRKMYTQAARQARQAYKEVKGAFTGSIADVMYRGDFKGFTTISKYGMKKSQLAKELAHVQRYLQSTFSSVEKYTEYRDKSIATFNANGYTFVNEENFNSVQEFMKDMTERGLKSIYGSDQVITAYNRAKKRGLTPQQLEANIEYWEKNAQAVEAGARSNKIRVYSRVPSGRSAI